MKLYIYLDRSIIEVYANGLKARQPLCIHSVRVFWGFRSGETANRWFKSMEISDVNLIW